MKPKGKRLHQSKGAKARTKKKGPDSQKTDGGDYRPITSRNERENKEENKGATALKLRTKGNQGNKEKIARDNKKRERASGGRLQDCENREHGLIGGAAGKGIADSGAGMTDR